MTMQCYCENFKTCLCTVLRKLPIIYNGQSIKLIKVKSLQQISLSPLSSSLFLTKTEKVQGKRRSCLPIRIPAPIAE